mgnify:CR=1 FL=1
MDALFILALAAVLIVLLFDYTNGFHDAANIVASVIASRAMTPVQAILIVAGFEFLGPLLGGTAVANTIGKFIVLDGVPRVAALTIILCGLVGAIAWNLLTWWRGIPSSSSHALVGGLAGAVVVSVGADHVVWGFVELADGHVPIAYTGFVTITVSETEELRRASRTIQRRCQRHRVLIRPLWGRMELGLAAALPIGLGLSREPF